MGLIITLDEARAYDYRTNGPIGIDLSFNQHPEFPDGLKDKIGRVAALDEKPDKINGQRSSLIELNTPWKVRHGFEVQAVQVKGHFFRPSEESFTITPPQMRMYLGRGHPPTLWRFDESGTIDFMPSADIPSGCMLYENAAIEFAAGAELHKQGLPVVFPVAFGKFTDLEFCVADALKDASGMRNPFREQLGGYEDEEYLEKRHAVGFVVHGVYNPDNKRAIDALPELAADLSPAKKKELLDDFFQAYGRSLRQFHQAGYIHAWPHLDNISLNNLVGKRLKKKGPNRLRLFSDLEIVFHDIAGDNGELLRKQDMPNKSFLGYAVWDLTNVTEGLEYFFDSPEYWTEAGQKLVQSGMPDQQQNTLRRYKKLWDLSQEANFNPTESFFRGYFGNKFKRFRQGYFLDSDAVYLSKQLQALASNAMVGDVLGMPGMGGGEKPNVVKLARTVPVIRVLADMYL